MYIQPNGSDTKYDIAMLAPFSTSNGYEAVKIVSDIEIPLMSDGFVAYINEDDEKVFADYSEYKYLYKTNEYAVAEDTPSTATPSNDPIPTSAFEALSNRVAQLTSQVNSITPYTETKQAYIGDTECDFDYREGNVSAWVADGQIPCEIVIEDDLIKVLFEELDEVATVKINIQ